MANAGTPLADAMRWLGAIFSGGVLIGHGL